MTDRTVTRQIGSPQLGFTTVLLSTGDSPTLTGGTDTLTLTLSSVGIANLMAFQEYVHTTDNSVIVASAEGACTSSVTSGVATFVTSSGNNNKKRVIIVTGTSNSV